MTNQRKNTTKRPAEPRRTRQRQSVMDVLKTHNDFASAQRIHALLSTHGHDVGLATVYRTLSQLLAVGEVDTIVSDAGEVLYRRCSSAHHHHLVCRRCGTTVEVQDHQVEQWAEAVAHAHGFADVQHKVEVIGICGACSA